MESRKPRIANLPRERWTDEARQVFSYFGEPDSWENGSKTNILMVMANHPRLGLAYNAFGKHLLLDSSLPVRPRELVVMRTSWHAGGEYEWHYHVGYCLNIGMTMEEIAAIKDGPSAPNWNEEDCAVLTAVDELWETNTISDETWATLSKYLDEQARMDLVFTMGNYVMLTWALHAFGVPLEEGVDRIGFDLKSASGRTPGVRYRPGEHDDWPTSG